MAETVAGNVPCRLVDLDRIDLTEGPEHRQIVAGAAADFEDPRLGGKADLAPDQLAKDVPSCPIPPVTFVQLGHPVVDDPLHQAKTHCRLREKVASGVTNTIGMTGHQVGPSSGPVRMPTNRLLRPRLTSETTKKRPVLLATLSRLP